MIRVEANPHFRDIGGRNDDVSPFWGGARIDIPVSNQRCSTSFGFTLNGYDRMITAGHCAQDGGYVWSHSGATCDTCTGTYGMGYIYAGGQFENWNVGVGTTMINGRYDGDMAMVTLDTGRQSGNRIYTGGPTGDVTSAPVKEMWWREPNLNDQHCTGGHASGSLCSWTVTVANENLTVQGGYLQNVTRSTRSGTCVQGGDSGGSVYTVRPDGGIAAKGILSQAGIVGCQILFTDVRRASGAWPGMTLKLAP